jgi:hypothetical protein
MEVVVLRLCIAAVLIAICIQDLYQRRVSWYLFPALAMLLFMGNAGITATDMLINAGFILLVFSMLSLWFSVRLRRPVNLFKEHIGLGDLLLLLCLVVYFTPVNFFLFYLASLFVISAGAGIYLALKKPGSFTIPLAGLQGLILLLLLLGGWITGLEIGNADLTRYLL